MEAFLGRNEFRPTSVTAPLLFPTGEDLLQGGLELPGEGAPPPLFAQPLLQLAGVDHRDAAALDVETGLRMGEDDHRPDGDLLSVQAPRQIAAQRLRLLLRPMGWDHRSFRQRISPRCHLTVKIRTPSGPTSTWSAGSM